MNKSRNEKTEKNKSEKSRNTNPEPEKRTGKKQLGKGGRAVIALLLVICSCAIAFSAYKLIQKEVQDRAGRQNYDRIREAVISTQPGVPSREETTNPQPKETVSEPETKESVIRKPEGDTETESTKTEQESEQADEGKTSEPERTSGEQESKRKEEPVSSEEQETEPETASQPSWNIVEPTKEELLLREVPFSVDFDALQSINEDIKAWIYIPSVEISYPVLQGEDNSHYLYFTADNTQLEAGSLFLDCENSSDFSDPNTIIYGHNRKDGSMFGTLYKISYENAAKDNPYIWIFTPDNIYRYRIFTAFYTDPVSRAYAFFAQRGKTFRKWCQEQQALSYADFSDVKFTKHTSVLTLSTCGYTSDIRTIVMAVRDGRVDPELARKYIPETETGEDGTWEIQT